MKLINLSYQKIIFLIVMASATLNIVANNLPLGMGSFAFLWFPIGLFLIISTSPSVFSNKPIINLLLYVIVFIGVFQNLLWVEMNDWNYDRILYETYYIFVSTVLLFYFISSRKSKYYFAWLVKWTGGFIILSLILTNIALFFDPMIVRESARTGEFTSYQSNLFNYTGCMGYSYIQAVIFLIPIIVYFIRSNRKIGLSKRTLVIVLILLVITQIRSQVFGNILVTIFAVIASLTGFKSRRITFSIITILLFLFLLIPNSTYSDFLYQAANLFPQESELNYKFSDFAKFVDSPEIDTDTGAGARAERYPLLFDAFLNNPLFGHAAVTSNIDIWVGAHLYWMNRLALWGLLGFTAFIYVLYKIFFRITQLFDSDFKFYYTLSLLSFVLLGMSKAIGGVHPWLFLIFIIPGLYFLPLLQQRNAVIISQKSEGKQGAE